MKQIATLAPNLTQRRVCDPAPLCCVTHRNEFMGSTVTYPNGVVVNPPCQECIDDENHANSMQVAKEQRANRQHALNMKLGHSGIPRKFCGSTLDMFHTNNDGQVHALNVCREYTQNLAANLESGEGLLFIGPPGTGKTHLATAICREVIQLGHRALFTSTLEFTQIVKETYMPGSVVSERQAIQEFAAVDLLVLDEVGVQHQSKVERMLLTELINQRYSAMRPTILLTNLQIEGPAGLGELLGERIISRLREVSQVVMFLWEDQRKRSA